MKFLSIIAVSTLTVSLLFLPAAYQSVAVGSGSDQHDSAQTARPVFKSIPPTVAAELMQTREDLLIADVRTHQERQQSRIAGSQLVPVGSVMRGQFNPDPDIPVLVICAVGGRSYVAGKVMTARGHREVYNLEGGIESWRKAGLPIETGPESK